MEQKFLIDTNVIIDYFGNLLPDNALELLDQIINKRQIFISVITQIELLGFNGLTDNELKLFQEFVNISFVENLNKEIIDKTIELRKKHKIKLPDAVISATSISRNYVLLTRNVKDFRQIDELQLLNPYKNLE